MLRHLARWLWPPPPVALEAQELLGPVFEGQPELEVGWPDDEVDVAVADPERLRQALTTVLSEFRALWPGAPLVADVDVSIPHRRLDIRVTRIAASTKSVTSVSEYEKHAQGPRRCLDRALPPLAREAAAIGTSASRGYDGTYFGFNLPVRAVGQVIGRREHFPKLDESSWEEHYRQKLERTSWSGLRDAAYRFSSLAIHIADWAVAANAQRVLIPSVGLCVDPWIFASRGRSVVATEISRTALDTVRQPECNLRIYGPRAKVRWDISELAMYGGAHPSRFEGLPDLADANVVAELRAKLEWLEADWAALPIEDNSIDVVFATNALPRDDLERRRRVVREWARVVRPGGFVFSAMHNPRGEMAGPTLSGLGWQPIDALRGPPPTDAKASMFQEYFSSG